MKNNLEIKCIDFIHMIIVLLIILIIPILFFYGIIELYKAIPKYETHYIDLDGNEGIARYCDRNMNCLVENKMILVKEYWKVEIK